MKLLQKIKNERLIFMKKSNKILAGIMAVSIMGGVAVIPNANVSTAFADYEDKIITVSGPDSELPPIEVDDAEEFEEATTIVKSGKWGKSGTWTLDSDGILTISGEKTFGGLGDKLTSDEIKTVCGLVVEEGITDISTSAFSGYSKLEYITLPDTLENIGDSAFYRCSSLYDVELPENLKAIGEYSFKECKSLTSIVIPDSVTSIGREAFYNSGLKSLVLGRGLIFMDSYAFYETGLGTADYRGTKKEWEAVKKATISIGATINCLVVAGDANEDGAVNISDAVLIMQSISNPAEYTIADAGILNADVVDTGDSLTINDALAIQMVEAKLISVEDFPVTSEQLSEISA